MSLDNIGQDEWVAQAEARRAARGPFGRALARLEAANPFVVGGVLFAVEMALLDNGVKFKAGSGTGAAAEYFDDFEPASMRRVIEQGLQRQAQPGRADTIRARAAQFDWDRAAAAYLALYRRLLALPPG